MLLILSAACYAWIGFYIFNGDFHAPGVTVCLFKNVTGIPCPSCGTTRSLLLLMAGDLPGVLLTNPLGLLAGFALLAVPVWICTDIVIRKNTLARSFLWTEEKIKTNKRLYIPLVALGLLNWGWNILKEL